MNGEQPKIEIFEPFGAAFEMMKRILFQPFDFAKWCVIGFAAFMSGSWGSNFRFRFPMTGDWRYRSHSYHNLPTAESMPAWLIPLIIALAILVVIIVFVVMWVVSRGRFIFTDCVVKNRAAIAAPWREYRREGNSFFLFSLVVALLAIVIVAVLVLLIAVPLGLFAGGKGTAGFGATAIFAIVFVGLVWLALTIFFAVVTQFMVPVMYRRRCLAREAFFDVSKLLLARPGPFVLFVLFGIVLIVALAIVGTIVSCLTCCIAALPYVSSVVLLPAFVWLLAFKLLFLRQFGPEYDVWATADVLSPAASPVAPPSVAPPPTE
ncbi:MAG: hypothetical protein QOC70_997 [Verrucomicrobiota bacterium]|jgi:hypothetical protein